MSAAREKSPVGPMVGFAALVVAGVIAVESHLNGPTFLALYVGLMVVFPLVGKWLDGRAPPAETPAGQWTDPYLLAYLAGGPGLALRTAAISLVDRGLLLAQDRTLAARSFDATTLARRPIEREILQDAFAPVEASEMFGRLEKGPACEEIKGTLVAAGLMAAGAPVRARRAQLVAIGVVALFTVSVVRIALCLSRGQTRLLFLVLLTVAAVVGALLLLAVAMGVVPDARPTPSGAALLADMRTLFGTLPARTAALRPGGSTSELAFLVSLFGLASVPAFASATVAAWTPRPPVFAARYSGGSDSGSSSSCSSSFSSTSCASSSSCGSSCSSSSCGGGGGCGGCGS